MEDPQMSLGWASQSNVILSPFSALTLLVRCQQGHLASEKSWVLVCWWGFDWSFVCLIGPSCNHHLLSSSRVQNVGILVPSYPGCPGKWPLNESLLLLLCTDWQVPWDGAQEMPLQQERTWDPVLQGVPMRCEMHQTSWLRCAPVQTQGPSSVFVSVSDFYFLVSSQYLFYRMMMTGHSFNVHFPGQCR